MFKQHEIDALNDAVDRLSRVNRSLDNLNRADAAYERARALKAREAEFERDRQRRERIRVDQERGKVLERPEIPLRTNGSENDIRCQVNGAKSQAAPAAIAPYTKSNTASKVAKGSFMALQRRCARP
jgi:hypothetical protein